MALIQALLAFVGRSAGKILYAIFGWAVRALFGYTTGARRTILTGLVALAALWPVLLLGIALPRVAAFAIAFVPLPKSVHEGWLRAGWIVLAVVVPTLVGVMLAVQRPQGEAEGEPGWKRVARGYPITVGISAAFWLSFVSVPVQRIVAAAHRFEDAYVPLVTTNTSYAAAAARIERVLDGHGFALRQAEPGFWTRAPLQVLRALGGAAMRDFVPERLAYFEGHAFVAALYPSGLLLRGPSDRTALAHGLAVEALTTCDADAQRLEREIHRVWHVLDEDPAHRDAPPLRSRVHDIASELVRSKLPYDDWQIVYRQLLQLSRALGGEPQILAVNERSEGDRMQSTHPVTEDRVAELPIGDLLREIGAKGTLLARKEIELGRAEIHHTVESELTMVKAFGVAAALAITTLNLLLVAGVLALARHMEPWLAALLVAGATLVLAAGAAILGWSRHVKTPLERTRRTLDEDVKWMKERLA
jgi:Putative Actinobacterial Holin-X, holin superfamily III